MCVVIGIFFVLVGIYWLFFGHRFEGPVSTNIPIKISGCSELMRYSVQKFDVILGEQADNVTARSHSVTMSINDKEMAAREDHV